MKNYELEEVNLDFNIVSEAFCCNLRELYCYKNSQIRKASKSILKMNEYNEFLFNNSVISDYLFNDINKAIEKIKTFKKTKDLKVRSKNIEFLKIVNSEIIDELNDIENEIKEETVKIVKNLNRY